MTECSPITESLFTPVFSCVETGFTAQRAYRRLPMGGWRRLTRLIKENFAMIQEFFVQKGRQYPIVSLLPWSRTAIENARELAAPLAVCGWSEQDTQDLERLVQQLESASGQHQEEQTDSRLLTVEERVARQEAKCLIRKVYTAVRIVTRQGAVEGVDIHSLPALGRLNTSARVAAGIHEMLPLIARLDSRLTRFFNGQNASQLLQEAADRLSRADALQEVSRQSLPENTLQLQELKGRVLERVEELNAVARIAFDGQAEIRSRFNKDVLLRSRRVASESPAPSSPSA